MECCAALNSFQKSFSFPGCLHFSCLFLLFFSVYDTTLDETTLAENKPATMSLAACGVDALWTPLSTPPFTGKLKTTPEDFIVVEVDPSGQRTDCDAYDFDKAAATAESAKEAPGDDNDALGKVEVEEEEGCESTTVAPLRLLSFLNEHDGNLLHTLGDVDSVVARSLELTEAQLRALLISVKGTSIPDNGSDSSEVRWWEKEYSLGTAYTKDQRRLLHYGVRARYTHIRSRARTVEANLSASSASSEPLQEVYAMLDPHFVLFVFLFGAGVATRLATWATRTARAHLEHTNLSDDEVAQLNEFHVSLDGAAGGERTRAGAPDSVLYTSFRDVPLTAAAEEGGIGTISAKELRRQFHEVLRRFYPYVRCQVTDGRVALRYQPSRPHAAASSSASASNATTAHLSGVRRPRDENESGGGSRNDGLSSSVYTYLIVRKRNVDVMELASLLGERFHVKDTFICFAGRKDKVGITYQRCSVPGDHSAIARKSDTAGDATPLVTLRWPSDPLQSFVDVLHCSRVPRPVPLRIGELRGNFFTIALRGVHFVGGHTDISSTPSSSSLQLPSPGEAVIQRFNDVAKRGFVNYFGQQRFSESISALHDHTGLYLFAGQWVAAVRSVFRTCPELYDSFPEKMDVRFVPPNARDAVRMTHALRQTYRMYFGEHLLTRDDVQQPSALWTRVCEKAVCESVPFAIRSMWVSAAQSVFFNVCASHLARRLSSTTISMKDCGLSTEAEDSEGSTVWGVSTPVGGYPVERPDIHGPEPASVAALRAEAQAYALSVLHLRKEQMLEQRKVAGVPVPGSWRAVFVRPRDATAEVVPGAGAEGDGVAVKMSFFLPPSSYATSLVREVMGTAEWL